MKLEWKWNKENRISPLVGISATKRAIQTFSMLGVAMIFITSAHSWTGMVWNKN